MSVLPRPPQHIAFDAGALVAVGRHRVGVAGEHQPRRAAEVGAGHHVVADALDGQTWQRAQAAFDVVGQRGLSVAGRRDVDQRGGAREQISHQRVTP